MERRAFNKWLKEVKGYQENTASSRVSNCQRIEDAYGNLDEHYARDKLDLIINDFDNLNHKIKINGNYSTGTSTLKQALNLYIEFKDGNIIDNIINAKDINPDSHDGSYELVRETVESLSKVEKDILDINDLNLLYAMTLGTWKLSVSAKSERIYNSNLSSDEKDRLNIVLEKVENKAKAGEYSNRIDGKDTIGMFGTGFYVFDGKTTIEDASKFISLCVDIKDMLNEEDILKLVENTFKDGLSGIQAASASIILHCLKPTVFPVINGGVIDGIAILEDEGVVLDRPNRLTTYIDNVRKIKKFRDDKCRFKNYRVLDIELWRCANLRDSNNHSVNNLKQNVYINKKENLNDLLKIPEDELMNYKIKLNIRNLEGTEPMDVMIGDEESRYNWMGWKYHSNDLSRDYVIGLARDYKRGQNFWRFLGVFKILDRNLDVINGVGYKLEELEEYNEYKNTLLLDYKNTSQNLFRNAENIIDEFIVVKDKGIKDEVTYEDGKDYLEEKIEERTNIGEERLEAIVDAFKKIGGEGKIGNIFEIVKNDPRFRIHRFSSHTNAEGSIRLIIQQHSSDTQIYKDMNEDLFYSVDGIGKGVWGLRKHNIELTPIDFAKPLDFSSLYFEDINILKKQISTALKSGKSIILIGPPGTGKSKLAKSIAKSYGVKSKMVTAMSDWSSYDTIGGYKPSKDGSLYFEEGIFLSSLKDSLGKNKNQWLIIDEINRADIDKAFGPFFSALSGDDIELGLKDRESRNIELLLEENLDEDTKVEDNQYIIPRDWRIIGTMNTFDKTSLYEMSYAFMRRFAFIPVAIPRNIDSALIEELLSLWDIEVENRDHQYIAELWKTINKYRKIGPAIVEDIAKFIELGGDYTSSIVIYILPQLEGLFDDRISNYFKDLKKLEFINDVEILEESIEDFFDIKLSGE